MDRERELRTKATAPLHFKNLDLRLLFFCEREWRQWQSLYCPFWRPRQLPASLLLGAARDDGEMGWVGDGLAPRGARLDVGSSAGCGEFDRKVAGAVDTTDF